LQRTHAPLSILLTVVAALMACFGRNDAPVLVLDGLTIIDGSGAPPTPGGRIVIRGGHIEAAGPADSVSVPRGAERLDLTGKWVLPGLIDLHTHPSPWTFSRFVAWGVTTIRDLHSDSATATAVHDLANLGGVIAPRVFTSGPAIDGAPAWPPGAIEVTDPGSARRAVDAQLLAGRDWIKTQVHLTPELFAAVLSEATQLHIPVAAHLGLVDAVTAARAGVRTIEHLSGVVEAASDEAGLLRSAHQRPGLAWPQVMQAWGVTADGPLDGVAQALARTGVFLVPTLVAEEALAAGPGMRVRPGEIPDSVLDAWRVAAVTALTQGATVDSTMFPRAFEKQAFFLRKFRDTRGVVVAGTNSPRPGLAPGASLHRELELLVQVGLTPAEAIRAATMDAALALAADSLGRVAAGRVADLVVVEADPLADIRNLQRIGLVFIRGNPTDPRDLRREW